MKNPEKVVAAFRTGVIDGFEQPEELSSGMTYPKKIMQTAYDEGVNLGQTLGKKRPCAATKELAEEILHGWSVLDQGRFSSDLPATEFAEKLARSNAQAQEWQRRIYKAEEEVRANVIELTAPPRVQMMQSFAGCASTVIMNLHHAHGGRALNKEEGIDFARLLFDFFSKLPPKPVSREQQKESVL